jgi:hypothetical protein
MSTKKSYTVARAARSLSTVSRVWAFQAYHERHGENIGGPASRLPATAGVLRITCTHRARGFLGQHGSGTLGILDREERGPSLEARAGTIGAGPFSYAVGWR